MTCKNLIIFSIFLLTYLNVMIFIDKYDFADN